MVLIIIFYKKTKKYFHLINLYKLFFFEFCIIILITFAFKYLKTKKMSWTIIIVLILIGLLFLILETLVVPGTTVVGIFGFALLAFSIYKSYAVYGATAGHITLGSTAVLTLILLFFAIRSKTWNKLMLKSNISSKVNTIDEEKLKKGDVGETVSRLVTGGKAKINGEFYEVHSTGAFIDQHSKIVVTKIEANKIYVKLKK